MPFDCHDEQSTAAPAEPGSSGEPWTERDDLFLREAAAAGTSKAKVARLLGRSEGTVRKRYLRLAGDDLAAAEAARLATRQKQRRCLYCRGVFLSAHAGNRLCDPCRALVNDITATEPDVVPC